MPADRIEAVLAKLETRGFTHLGRLDDYKAFSLRGWSWSDPDVAELVGLLGRTAHSATSYSPPPGQPGGWGFAFGYHHASRPEPDGLCSEVDGLLTSASLSDLRSKLAASACTNRVAVLVYDTTTSIGRSFAHWARDLVPTRPAALPTEVTAVVLTGLNGFVLVYDAAQGWRRRVLDPDDP